MTDRTFSHPNFGNQVRIEQDGTEVHLIFNGGSMEQANSMCDSLIGQLKAGGLNITLMGKPTSIEDTAAPTPDARH